MTTVHTDILKYTQKKFLVGIKRHLTKANDHKLHSFLPCVSNHHNDILRRKIFAKFIFARLFLALYVIKVFRYLLRLTKFTSVASYVFLSFFLTTVK